MTGIYMIRVTNSAAIASSFQPMRRYIFEILSLNRETPLGGEHNYLRPIFCQRNALEFFKLIKINQNFFQESKFFRNLIAHDFSEYFILTIIIKCNNNLIHHSFIFKWFYY